MSCVADLNQEYETFQQKKEELIASSAGKYALISGDSVLSVWETYEDALKAGYDRCGVDTPFMVQRITMVDRVHLIYRGSVV